MLRAYRTDRRKPAGILPELNGLDAAEIFRKELPEVRLLILSMHADRAYISSALSAGARGYILKDVSTDEMVTAIEAIWRAGFYFSSGLGDVFSTLRAEEAGAPALTSREHTTLLLADGLPNKEVARQLDISVRTVETHRKKPPAQVGYKFDCWLDAICDQERAGRIGELTLYRCPIRSGSTLRP